MKIELPELIFKVLSVEGDIPSGVARKVSGFFNDMDEFLNCTYDQLKNLKTVSGKPIPLEGRYIQSILHVASSGIISPSSSVIDNYIRVISMEFTKKQIETIKAISLSKLNVNPLLVRSLNLKTPLEMLEFNIYAAVSRSIVTSMGYFVQNLLSVSSESVEKVQSGWDIVKHDPKGIDHFIQVKSGPNDMDKDQIVYWLRKIVEAESSGNKGYIGITYGKRENNTVSLSLMRTYLPNMEFRTLVGRELWDFLTDDPNFHERLFENLRVSAARILGIRSIEEEIRDCINKVHEEFKGLYGDGSSGLESYLSSIF